MDSPHAKSLPESTSVSVTPDSAPPVYTATGDSWVTGLVVLLPASP